MPLLPVPFRGGLDLMSPATSVAPGTLKECQNYERGIREGYTRVDGFERTDGVVITQNTGVNGYKIIRLTSTRAGGASPAPGTYTPSLIRLTNAAETITYLYGFALGNQVISSDGLHRQRDIICNPGAFIASDGEGYLWEANAAGTSETVALHKNISFQILSPDETDAPASIVNTAIDYFASVQRALAVEVPGRAGSDIIGAFWLKHRLYAIRDLERLDFTDGMYTDANEGQFVTIGAAEYEILAVTQTAGGGGFLTLDPVAGSGADATGISAPAALAITGTPPDCDVGVYYNEDEDGFTFGIDNETGAVTWSIVDDVLVTSSLIDADNPSLVSQQTNAALWKADDNGWSRVDTGREMLFSDGTASLAAFARTATLDGVCRYRPRARRSRPQAR
jgi:hypothetical protein